MSERVQRSLDRAKESGNKAAEGTAELGKGVLEIIGGTAESLFQALKYGYFKFESRDSNEKEKQKCEIASNIAKDNMKNGRNKAWEGTKDAFKGGGKMVWNGAKGVFHLVDAGDKKIGDIIIDREIKKNKGKNSKENKDKSEKDKDKFSEKVKRFVRDNATKIMIALSTLSYGGYQATTHINGKDDGKQKQIEVTVIDDTKDEKQTEEININDNTNEYLTNPNFFEKNLKVVEDNQYKEKYGVELKRDAGMTFYVVQKGDGLIKIRNKLSKIPEFSYLANKEYDIPTNNTRNIKSFNIPNNELKPGFYLPIPVKSEYREISDRDFKVYGKKALNEMKTDSHYGKQISEMINSLKKNGASEDQIVNVMTAFARCETAQDWKNFSDKIGDVTLNRREPRYKAFSFSYFHILMGEGPGLTARKNLGLTEGQCYHPQNACKLFLAYCCEKKQNNPDFFFNIKTDKDAKNVGKCYNGSATYGPKLKANVDHCSTSSKKSK